MTKKPVSHFQRMCENWKKAPRQFHSSYRVMERVETVVDGRVVATLVEKTVIPSEKFAGLRASDFALENVIAAGAMDLLKPALIHDESLDTMDMVDNTLNGIMDQIDAQAQAEAPKNNENE